MILMRAFCKTRSDFQMEKTDFGHLEIFLPKNVHFSHRLIALSDISYAP